MNEHQGMEGQGLPAAGQQMDWSRPTAKAKYAVLPVSDEECLTLETSENLSIASKGSTVDPGSVQPHTCWQLTLGWACMLLAVFAGASIGPIFKYMMSEGVPVMLASSWRNQTMVLSLIPMAVYEAYSKKENRVDWFAYKPDLPYPVCVHVMISGVSWAINLLCWVVGLQYVSTFKASVVVSCHPVLLVIAMRFTGHSVSLAEWIGVFVAFVGMFVSEYKPSSSSSASSSESQPGDAIDEVPFKLQMFGYLMCLLAAAGEVVTILNRIKTRKYVPLLQYTLVTSILVMLYATALSMLVEHTALLSHGQLCFEQHCILGWMTKRWLLRTALFGLWVGTVCFTGFNYAVAYIPPLVFSSVTLVDPAVTAITSWICGIELLPGVFSWLGGVVVIAGVAVISWGERQRRQGEKQLDVLAESTHHMHEHDVSAVEDALEMKQWTLVESEVTV